MRRTAVSLAALLWAAPALAQTFPLNLPANSVYGRLGVGSGPGQAIPFSQLGPLLGVAAAPLSNGHIFVGNASNVATDVALSGAGTITNAGVLSINLAAGASFITGNVPLTNICSGTGASATTFLRGDCTWTTPTGSGDVVGPGSATDNAVARFDGTTGKLIQNSAVTIADTTGIITGPQGFVLTNTGSGTTALNAPATGANTLTLPGGGITDTLIGKATVDTLTNKTYDTAGTGNSFSINGLAATANTGTGAVVRAAGATLSTPTLGVALATSINGNTFTVGTYTLTGVAGKTLTFNKSITLEGTDGTTLTGPSSNATLASLNIEDQALTGGANVTTKALSTGSITVDCGARPIQNIANNGAFTITAPGSDGSCIVIVTNTASASTITMSGFSVGSNVGDALTTTNGHKFSFFIWRANGTSGYSRFAHQ